MATRLNGWIIAPLAACVVIGATRLPPRGGFTPGGGSGFEPHAPAARADARTLADQWRSARARLDLARYRQRLAPELARRQVAEQVGAALWLDLPDSIRRLLGGPLRQALDTAWVRLGLGLTKVAVGVVIIPNTPPGAAAGDHPPIVRRAPDTYLLPDSLDRGTCVAVVRPPFFLPGGATGPDERLVEWMEGALGPCAFYARFGVPGPRVAGWLARRRFDLARIPRWDRDGPPAMLAAFLNIDARRRRWWWPRLYGLPRPALGCLAGRTAACRAAVAAGDGGIPPPPVEVVQPESEWRMDRQLLVTGPWFLATVVRRAGPGRFLDFWTTTLPVDSALSLALAEPVGRWTAGEQRRIGPPVRLGAAPSWPVAALAVALVLGALLVGWVTVNRRQVA